MLRDDYATTVEEMSLGACSVAVPIRRRGDVVAALGIVVPSLKRDRAEARRRAPGRRPRHRPRARLGSGQRNRRVAGRHGRDPLTGTMADSDLRTQVAIVGAGPAGMLLSHLLAADGVESVVVETRSEEYVASRIRAGILEQSTVDLLRELRAGRAAGARGRPAPRHLPAVARTSGTTSTSST